MECDSLCSLRSCLDPSRTLIEPLPQTEARSPVGFSLDLPLVLSSWVLLLSLLPNSRSVAPEATDLGACFPLLPLPHSLSKVSGSVTLTL